MGTRERHKPSETPGVQADHGPANDNTKDVTMLSPAEGIASGKHNPESTLRTKDCVIGHCAFVPRMGSKTQNIQLEPGLAQSYMSKPAIHALKEFGQQLLLLTQTVEALFKVFLPEEHSKYMAFYEDIYDRRADKVDKVFGIWTSRLFIVNANTKNHKSLEDVCHKWFAIVPIGDFEGGDACFPELGVKIDCPPGT